MSTRCTQKFYQLSEEVAAALATGQMKMEGRVIAVGTTSIRYARNYEVSLTVGIHLTDSGWTNIFIKPGYDWKVVDAFSTNFHLA